MGNEGIEIGRKTRPGSTPEEERVEINLDEPVRILAGTYAELLMWAEDSFPVEYHKIINYVMADFSVSAGSLIAKAVETITQAVEEGRTAVDWPTHTGEPEPEIDVDDLLEALQRIRGWALEAYPEELFPTPNMEEVRFALEKNGLSLGSVSAYILRKALAGIGEIAQDALDGRISTADERLETNQNEGAAVFCAPEDWPSLVREMREAKGMTQSVLADKLGFNSAATISHLERGIRGIGIDGLSEMAEALGLKLEFRLSTMEDEQ